MSVLKDHVEAIVARVRASDARKDLMREEISAHLAEAYGEEAARVGEGREREAAERAVRRLGEPAELVRSLQASVPAIEGVLCAPIPGSRVIDAWDRALQRRGVETPVQHAARVTGWLVAMIAAAMAAVVAAVVVAKGGRLDVPAVASFAAASLGAVGLGTFVAPLLCGAMARALWDDARRRRRSIWPALHAALAALGVLATLLLYVLIAELGSGHGPLFPRAFWPRILVLALAAPAFVGLTAGSINARRRRAEGWELPGSASAG